MNGGPLPANRREKAAPAQGRAPVQPPAVDPLPATQAGRAPLAPDVPAAAGTAFWPAGGRTDPTLTAPAVAGPLAQPDDTTGLLPDEPVSTFVLDPTLDQAPPANVTTQVLVAGSALGGPPTPDRYVQIDRPVLGATRFTTYAVRIADLYTDPVEAALAISSDPERTPGDIEPGDLLSTVTAELFVDAVSGDLVLTADPVPEAIGAGAVIVVETAAGRMLLDLGLQLSDPECAEPIGEQLTARLATAEKVPAFSEAVLMPGAPDGHVLPYVARRFAIADIRATVEQFADPRTAETIATVVSARAEYLRWLEESIRWRLEFERSTWEETQPAADSFVRDSRWKRYVDAQVDALLGIVPLPMTTPAEETFGGGVTTLPGSPVQPVVTPGAPVPLLGMTDEEERRFRVGQLAEVLRRAYEDKAAYVRTITTSDPRHDEMLAEHDAAIAGALADLRAAGVRGTITEVVERAVAGADLTRTVVGIRHTPAKGPYRQGEGIRFVVDLSYVPPEHPVRVEWAGEMEGAEYPFTFPDRAGARDTELVLDAAFWFRAFPMTLAAESDLTVTAKVTVGTTELSDPALTVSLPITPYRYGDDENLVQMSLRGGAPTGPASAKALVGSELTFTLSQGPPGWQYTTLWSWMNLDKGEGFPGHPIPLFHERSDEVTHTFSDAGKYAVLARIFPFQNQYWTANPIDTGEAPPTAAMRVEVGTLDEWGTMALGQLEAEKEPRPSLAQLSARLDAEAAADEALAARATGEDKEHYTRLAEQRREMATKLYERLGVLASAVEPMPARDEDYGSGVYATSVPAALVIANSASTPGGGIQPLTLYLTMRRSAKGFSAKLIDATTKDMTPYEGEGEGSTAAAEAAIAQWEDRNPYPIGGLAVYRYTLPGGEPQSGRFLTTTREKEIEKFVEDILTIGGYVVGVLLLLAPEATVTKALGLGLLGIGLGYGAYRISRNVELGIGLLDSRNVLEAVGILASVAGISGSAMRAAGLRASRPLVYRAGSWMVMSSIAVDAGSLAYVGVESYEMLRASLDDPNLTDSDRVALLARMVGQFIAQSAMFVVGNKEMFQGGLKKSDFFGTRKPGLADLPGLDPTSGRPLVELDTGSRIDLQAELIRRGASPDDVLHLSDVSLLQQLHSVQQGSARGPGVLPLTDVPLTQPQQHAVVLDVRTATLDPDVTLARTSNPLAMVMTVNGTTAGVHVRFQAPAGEGVHGARSGAGRLRVDLDPRTGRWVVEVDIDPRLGEVDATLLLREELDEAAEIVRRLRDRTRGADPLRGPALREAIEAEQRASLARPAVIGDTQTAHDVSAFRSLARMFERLTVTGEAADADRLDRMLIEMGFNPLASDPRVREAMLQTLGAARAEPLFLYIWGAGDPKTAPPAPFRRPLIDVPSARTHDPAVVAQVRAYTEALADMRAGHPDAVGRMNAIEQLAAAGHGVPVLTVEALMREGMPRKAAQDYVAGAAGGNPYTHLYDVLLTTFELRRAVADVPEVAGRRFTVAEPDGTLRSPRAIEALNAGGAPEGISFTEFMRRMDATGVKPTVKPIQVNAHTGQATGNGWVEWSFTEPDKSISRIRLDIPGDEASTGGQRGYRFESAYNLHAGTSFTPAPDARTGLGSKGGIAMTSGAVEVLEATAGAHIRIVPDGTMAARLTALGLSPANGQRLGDVLKARNL